MFNCVAIRITTEGNANAINAIAQEQTNAQRQISAYITYSTIEVIWRPYSSDENSLIAAYEFFFRLKKVGLPLPIRYLPSMG